MEDIISSSRINKEKQEQEKYGKDNLNSYVHSGSSFMEFTKQRKLIQKMVLIICKKNIIYLKIQKTY